MANGVISPAQWLWWQRSRPRLGQSSTRPIVSLAQLITRLHSVSIAPRPTHVLLPPRPTLITITYIRPADAIYPGAATTAGASTPYFTSSLSYRPIMLNRPFRNVAELGYAFRDLPWKTLDCFTDKSADAGLLDIFCINDGPPSTTSYNGTDLGNVVPTAVAGKANLNGLYLDPSNSALAPVGQPILAGAIWDEIASPPSTVAATGSGAQTAQTMMSQSRCSNICSSHAE